LAPRHVASAIWNLRPLTALAAVLLVAGPWFAAVEYQTGGEFLEGFFGIHHFHRFTNPKDNHGGPIYFYLIALCIGFFPWCIFLSPCCIDLVGRFKDARRARPADALCLSWIAVWVGFFSLATTKFPHYILPAYPALALLTACFLDHWITDAGIYGKGARRTAWVTVALAGMLLAFGVPYVAEVYLPGESRLGFIGIPLICGAGLCAWFSERRQISRALASLTGTGALFSILLFAVAAVNADRHQNTAPLAAAIHARHPSRDVRIATFQYFRPGLVFYCNRQVHQFWDSHAAVEFLKDSPERSFLVTTEADYKQLAADLPAEFTILERSPWFLRTGKTLVLSGIPPRDETASPVHMTRADDQ
jgi:4-amino-4-deoxy-L-arabinose transferase-like glycosyltransferase